MQALTHRGLKRSNNEDAVAAEELADGYRLLAVADGVGGTRGGEVASAAAIGALVESLRGALMDAPAEALRQAFERANESIRESAAGHAELAAMSTTMVAALVRDRTAWLANVGDSRAYLVRDANAERLTDDHSWVEEQIRGGALAPDDPLVKTFGNIVTRVVGGDDQIEVDTLGPIDLPSGSALLLCSDGLHGVVSDEIIAEMFAGEPQGVGERLIQRAIDGGGPDNVSVVIFHSV